LVTICNISCYVFLTEIQPLNCPKQSYRRRSCSTRRVVVHRSATTSPCFYFRHPPSSTTSVVPAAPPICRCRLLHCSSTSTVVRRRRPPPTALNRPAVPPVDCRASCLPIVRRRFGGMRSNRLNSRHAPVYYNCDSTSI